MEREIICEECDGTGVEHIVGWNYGGTKSQRFPQDCWKCEGSGVLFDDDGLDDDSLCADWPEAARVHTGKGMDVAD